MSPTPIELLRVSRVARVLRSVAANSDPTFFLSDSLYDIADALEAILAHLTAPAPRPLAVGDRVEYISGVVGTSPVPGIVRAVLGPADGVQPFVKIEWAYMTDGYNESTARWWPASDFRRIDE